MANQKNTAKQDFGFTMMDCSGEAGTTVYIGKGSSTAIVEAFCIDCPSQYSTCTLEEARKMWVDSKGDWVEVLAPSTVASCLDSIGELLACRAEAEACAAEFDEPYCEEQWVGGVRVN